eukprot:TRINITY_DN105009_c0_g1_i1.p1 TRINITY_DN105009_c0_g1~~TRINITY_DN105009_c0_g1_i1.p1  ORF type:complete len:1013 (-),score=110.93 TRINITY_DN105009_c0_g1_i1:4125-7049(-)
MKPRTEDAKSQTVSPVKIHAPTPDLRNRQHLCGSVTDRFCSTKYLDLEKPRVLPRTLSKLKNRYNVSDEMNEKMRETQALKFLSSSRPHSITPFPVVEESSILTTVKRSTRNVTTSQLANFYTRKSITPIRQIPKLGVTRDVSYMLDLAKLQQKNPSDTLPSISIEELKDARARLDPSKDFSSILAGQDNNPKVHLFLKHNIFKKIPAEFYEQIQKPFFGDMLTSHKREAVDLLHKKQENDGGLGAPSSRNDSIILLRWFNSALEKLKDLDDAPRFELAQTVYYICFQEVIRQIAVHCVERGFIVWKLWNAYITLIEELALWYKRKVNKTVSRYDEQMQKIHERYEGEMEDMEQEVKNAIRETERAKKQVEEVEFKCEGYKIKIEKMKENAEEKDREHLYELQGYEDLKEKYERAKDKVREVREKMDELREEFDSYKMKLVANAKKGKSDSGVQVVKEDFPEIEIIEKKSDTMNMITVVEKIIDIYKEHSSGEAQTNDPDNNFAEPIEVNVVVPSEESPVQPLSTQLLEDLEWVAPSEEEHKNIPVIEQLEVEPTKPCKQQKELNTDKEVVAVNIALFITRSNKECQTGPIQRKIDSPAGAKLEIAKKPTIVAEDKEILQKPKGVTKVELRKQAPPGKEETMLREKVRNLVDEQLKLHEKLAKTSEDNKHIKEQRFRLPSTHFRELSKEQKKLAEAAEKVKNLEVENFLLKDKLETVKDRLRQVEKTEQDLTQLVEKLESEKNAAEFRQIKEKMKEVKKEHNKVNVEVETDNSIEYHTPLKLLKPKNIQKVDTSFDFAREITKTSILQKDVDREYPTSNHLIRVDAARTKRNFLKKPDNRIVPLLIEKVLRENSKIYSMPKKLLLKTISHLYAELVSAKDPASDLANYVFNIIMNRFGLQSIAERKFLQILAGCIKHRNCKRVQMFGKFLLGDYSLEDFKLYLAMLKAVSAPYFIVLTSQNQGTRTQSKKYGLR